MRSSHVKFGVQPNAASDADAFSAIGASTGRAVMVDCVVGVVFVVSVVVDDIADMASRISGANVVNAVVPLWKTGLA